MLIQLPTFYSRAFVFTLLLSTLAGCASNVSKPVLEADRDTSGVHSGQWVLNIAKQATTQQMPGNWTFTCNGKAFAMPMIVKDGVANARIFGASQTAFVNGKGDFRFEIPLRGDAQASGRSDLSIVQGGRTLIVFGNLKSGKGRATVGIAQFGNNGCTSAIAIDRAGKSI